jgi:peptidylprolyl isomerase/FKBP-type peptidyl-prolyl cis-trans isomerase FklB
VVASGPEAGVKPDGNDLVRVDYEGTLTDGKVFDSSFERGSPAVFHLDQVVPGWTEGLRNMRVGDEWILYIPPELGYGERGAGGMIPPNSVLVFRVKLLDVAPIPGDAPTRGTAAAAAV